MFQLNERLCTAEVFFCGVFSLWMYSEFLFENKLKAMKLQNVNENKQARLGNAPLGKLLFTLAVPTITAQLVNLLYNVVDRMYVGRIPGSGSLALASLGVCVPIIQILLAFSVLVGQGASARAGIAMGRNDYEEAGVLLGNSFVILTVISAVLCSILLIFRKPVLMAFGASVNTIDLAASYLGIYLLGTFFVLWVNGLNLFITVQGFTVTSMLTVLIGCVANIILDPIFIYGFNMGVNGAAIATVISQGMSAVWVIAFLCSKKSSLRLSLAKMKLNFKLMGITLGLGLSPFIMYATESLVLIVYNSGMQLYGNDMYVAAMSVVFSIHMIIFLPISGLCAGAVPIISFNYGAKNFSRVKKTFRLLLICCLGFAFATELPIELFPKAFFRLFSNDSSLLELGSAPLRIYMAASILMSVQNAVQNTFISIGEARSSIFIALLRKIVLLIPLALILPKFGGLGVWGLFLAEPISDTISATTSAFIFRRKSRVLLVEAKLSEA